MTVGQITARDEMPPPPDDERTRDRAQPGPIPECTIAPTAATDRKACEHTAQVGGGAARACRLRRAAGSSQSANAMASALTANSFCPRSDVKNPIGRVCPPCRKPLVLHGVRAAEADVDRRIERCHELQEHEHRSSGSARNQRPAHDALDDPVAGTPRRSRMPAGCNRSNCASRTPPTRIGRRRGAVGDERPAHRRAAPRSSPKHDPDHQVTGSPSERSRGGTPASTRRSTNGSRTKNSTWPSEGATPLA